MCVRSLASPSRLGILHCCGCGEGHWLWCRLAPVALIQPLAWEFPYTTGEALKKKKRKEKKKLGSVFFYNIMDQTEHIFGPNIWPDKPPFYNFALDS